MKKVWNSKIFIFLLGVIITSSSIVLASNYIASDITYTPSDSNWKVSNVAEAINSIELSKVSTNYSTEERVVGTWIDGKPLYQKTLSYALDGVNGWHAYNHNVSNVETIFVKDANVCRSTSEIYECYDSGSNGSGSTYGYASRTSVSMFTKDFNSSYSAIITIQYTKTTDQTNNS